MRMFQRLALDKNQLAINSASVTARSIITETDLNLLLCPEKKAPLYLKIHLKNSNN